MKNKIMYISFILSLFFCAAYTVKYKKTSGAHPGSTGAPGDLTCAQAGCHTDAQITMNAVSNSTVLFSTPDSSYVPGATYNLTVMTTGINHAAKFGFELVALKDSDSLNVGQFVITDVSRTQIISHAYFSDVRYSVTHKSAGTAATSSNFDQWVFSWTAPPVNEGKITFWYATMSTNNDATSMGDYIYLNSFQIHPSSVNSVKEIASNYEIRSVFDPTNNELTILYDLKGKRMVQVSLFDVTGKEIFKGPLSKQSGKQKQTIDLGSNYSKGAYLIQLQIDGLKATKKVIVN